MGGGLTAIAAATRAGGGRKSRLERPGCATIIGGSSGRAGLPAGCAGGRGEPGPSRKGPFRKEQAFASCPRARSVSLVPVRGEIKR